MATPKADEYGNVILGGDKRKKKSSEQLADSYEQVATETEERQQALLDAKIQAEKDRLEQRRADDAALTQQENEANQGLTDAQQRMVDWWDNREKELAKEQQEAKEENERLTQMENQRASWTGAGELAAALVNLFGVGELHATSQQYKDIGQDWMKKADADRKRRRERMDNIKERQRQVGERRAQFELASTQDKYKRMLDTAKGQYERKGKIDDIAAGIPVMQAQGEAAIAEAAGKIRLEGTKAVATQKTHEDASARGWAQLEQTKQYQNAQLAAKGLNPDGTVNETLTKQLLARTGGSGSGSSSIIAYPILDSTGHVNVARLNPKQLEEIKSAVQGTIKDELGAEQGKEFDKEFRRANTDKEREAVLSKWIGKSKTAEAMILSIDSAYQGNHGGAPAQESSSAGSDDGYMDFNSMMDFIKSGQ